jgi:hypothetical protein
VTTRIRGLPHQEDAHIAECAESGCAGFLVTLNKKHFPQDRLSAKVIAPTDLPAFVSPARIRDRRCVQHGDTLRCAKSRTPHRGGGMTAANYSSLELAYGFVSSAAYGEHRAYVSLDTGRIYWVSDDGAVEEDEDVPEDLETSERYVLVPHQHDVDLNRQLALDFTRPGAAEPLRRDRCLFPPSGRLWPL